MNDEFFPTIKKQQTCVAHLYATNFASNPKQPLMANEMMKMVIKMKLKMLLKMRRMRMMKKMWRRTRIGRNNFASFLQQSH
jgi:hypothetical protein